MGKKPGFLGAGLMAPLAFNEGRGIALSKDETDIQQSIRLILSTREGERRMRPTFGCRIHEYVFAPNNSVTHQQIREAVIDALTTWEPRIEGIEVEVKPDIRNVDRLNVQIKYKIRTTNVPQNMVYPFYIEGT